MDLHGKTAVVTGGGLGIGLGISEALGLQGCRVSICGRTESALAQGAATLKGKGVEVFFSTCDVSDRASVDGFFDRSEAVFGPTDILVNNAGIGGPTPIDDPDDSRWHQIIAINLDGSYFCARRALQSMPDGGRIINLSSVLGRFGVPGYAAYCTSKHGVLGLTRALALEVAHRKITVNAICPGWVDTRMAQQGMEAGAHATGTTYEEFRAQAIAEVPTKEIIQPEEIGHLAAFLASPGAANVTGQAYNMCGGQVMS